MKMIKRMERMDRMKRMDRVMTMKIFKTKIRNRQNQFSRRERQSLGDI